MRVPLIFADLAHAHVSKVADHTLLAARQRRADRRQDGQAPIDGVHRLEKVACARNDHVRSSTCA